MNYVRNLFLAISLLFLTACETVKECSWSAPIKFETETKEWLADLDWPDTAYKDFDQIGDHNQLYDRNCN